MESNVQASAPPLNLILEDLKISYSEFKQKYTCVPHLDKSFDDFFDQTSNVKASAPPLNLILEDLEISYSEFKQKYTCVPPLDKSFDDFFGQTSKNQHDHSHFWKKWKTKVGQGKCLLFRKSYNKL